VEFKLVSENKLKIVLTNEDMESMDITYDEIDYENTNTKKILREIFDTAKRLTGFDASCEKIFVEVHPDRKNEGCMISVTKLTPPKSEPYTYEKRYKKLYTGIKKKRLLYMFENSEILSSM